MCLQPAVKSRHLVCDAGVAVACFLVVLPMFKKRFRFVAADIYSSIRLCNLQLQIAVDWLHDCCHVVLPCAQIHVRVCYLVVQFAL